MNNTQLALFALLAGGALIYYANQPGQGASNTMVPPGSNYQGFNNTTGATVYVDAIGNIFNTLGQLIGNITTLAHSQQQTNTNTNTTTSGNGGTTNPQITGTRNAGYGQFYLARGGYGA